MVKKYQWNNSQLRKKSRIYDRVAGVFVVVVLVCLFVFPQMILFLAFMGIAGLCLLLSWKAQSDDKKLNKAGK